MGKSASFESLSSTFCDQMEVYSTADLVSIISQEMLIDVTIVFMESTKIKNTIIACMTDVDTLSGVSFYIVTAINLRILRHAILMIVLRICPTSS